MNFILLAVQLKPSDISPVISTEYSGILGNGAGCRLITKLLPLFLLGLIHFSLAKLGKLASLPYCRPISERDCSLGQ